MRYEGATHKHRPCKCLQKNQENNFGRKWLIAEINRSETFPRSLFSLHGALHDSEIIPNNPGNQLVRKMPVVIYSEKLACGDRKTYYDSMQ